jgi:hypothetical protein
VEHYAGILGLLGPITVEGNKEGDVSFHSFAHLGTAGKTSRVRLRERRSPGWQL